MSAVLQGLGPEQAALTAAAALAAGVLNAIAGGGSFLTFPALVFAGVPPLAANATSAMAVSPGYLGSTLGFRAELRALPAALLRREVLLAASGGLAGAALLLLTPARVFAVRARGLAAPLRPHHPRGPDQLPADRRAKC